MDDWMALLKQNIRKEMNQYADDVATGQCTSFEDYKRLCGVIQGLALAERLLLDLADKKEKMDG
jgi:hypothetical protein